MDEEKFNRLIETFNRIKSIYPSQSGPKLTTAQFDVLVKLIKESADAKRLFFHLQNLDGEQAKKLAAAITDNEKLEYLYVGLNGIGDKGAIALAGAVKTTTALEVLSIDGEQIGEAGIIALAKAVADHPSLVTLSLNSNPTASIKAIAALVEMIEGNVNGHKKLKKITLQDCNISLEAAIPIINMYGKLLKEGTLPEEMPTIKISPVVDAEMEKLLAYAKNVARPLLALKAAAGSGTPKENPAKKFVASDGDNAAQGKIKNFLGEMPKNPRPPTPG